MKVLCLAILVLVLLAGISYAACPEPDIKVYSACTDKCPDPVSHTFAYADCVNACLAMWSRMQDDYYACGKAEREAEEKARIERENKLRGIEEAKVITVSTVEGMLWLTNPEGLVNKLGNAELLDIKPGYLLRSEPDSTAVLTLKEGSRLQLGPDSQFTYIDGEPIIAGEPEKMKYESEVSEGRVRYTSDTPDVKYEVHTSQGTVVNRETDFIVEADNETDMTAVYLYEGILDVNTTLGDTHVLNTGEMMTIDSVGNVVISNLTMEDWYGLVNSISTGVEFTPSWKIPPETSTILPESLTDIVAGGSKRTFLIMLIIAAAVGITIGTVIRARRKKTIGKTT